jgi:basic membrane lipoprotein Med (substrate-binding protein (PBP1-ABC) superfamily)
VHQITAVANGGNVGTIKAAEESGAKFVGRPLDQVELSPETVAVSVLFDVPGYILEESRAVLEVIFEGELVAIGVAEGALSYGPFSDWVPQDVQDAASQVQDGLASGSLEIPEFTP